jgi:multimeric flavodoxin WrbA
MNIVIVNSSPRQKNSSTQYFIDELIKMLPDQTIDQIMTAGPAAEPDISMETEKALSACEALFFCFPIYVDSLPSGMIAMLEQWERFFRKVPHKKPVVYALAHCGFFEGEQNQIALEIMQHWCVKAGLVWGAGLGIGGSEMLKQLENVPLGHGPKTSLGLNLSRFAQALSRRQQDQMLFTSPNFPRFLYIFMGNQSWIPEGKKNGLKRKELYKVTLPPA